MGRPSSVYSRTVLVIRGLCGLIVLLLVMIGALEAGAGVATRLFSLPRFRWFAPRPLDAPVWQRGTVRAASAMAPFLTCLVLLWLVFLLGGQNVMTTTVEVLPGAARQAGMLDGDRIVSIDGAAMDSWEAIRATAKPGRGPAHIEIERAGTRRVLVVEPGPEGRYGIASHAERRALDAGTALRRAMKTPVDVYGAALGGLVKADEEPVALGGPVGIVRTTERANDTGSLVSMLMLLGLYIWPWLAGLQLWDAATLALFARTHAWTAGPPNSERVAYLCRLHQALGVTLVLSVVLLVLTGFLQLPLVGAVVLPFVLLLTPIVLGIYPLVWLTAKERWHQRSLLGVPALAVALVPCSGQLAALALYAWLRRELRRDGLELGWFVAAPRAPGA
jgi:membrane-associated protease RseP (regulator of RpoE activity)